MSWDTADTAGTQWNDGPAETPAADDNFGGDNGGADGFNGDAEGGGGGGGFRGACFNCGQEG